MNTTLLRATASFAVVLMAYTGYALLAVPLIEPQLSLPEPAERAGSTGADVMAPDPLGAIRHLFPEGAWERDDEKTKILETAYGKLLFQDFRPARDGTVEVMPFTLVYYTDSDDHAVPDGRQRGKPPVVMRAPAGAVLKFDRPLKLGSTNVGRLVGGRLRGDIHLYRPATDASADDSLDLVTRNLQIDGRRIFTPHQVQFRFGRHWGRGSDLVIQLLTAQQSAERKPEAFGIRGIQSIELVRIERVHLDAGGRQWLPELPDGDARQTGGSRSPAPRNQATPLEITCRGPFLFDVEQSVASFEDDVDVRRIRPDGPVDQLNCQLLEIHFAPRGGKRTGSAAGGLLGGLQPTRLVAEGHPVTVRSTSDMQARRLEYELGPPGQPGVLWADGPGWMEQARGQQKLTVHWDKELIAQPDEGSYVVSVLQNALVYATGMGRLAADELHVWVRPTSEPSAGAGAVGGGQRLVPDKLLALGNVRIDSPQLAGTTKRVEVWFEQPAAAAGGSPPAALASSAGQPSSAPQPAKAAAKTAGDLAQQGQPVGRKQAITGAAGTAAPLAKTPSQKFQISGDLVRMKLMVAEGPPEVQSVTIAGNVHLVETSTPAPSEAPLRVTGHILRLDRDRAGSAQVEVSGDTAHVEARGLSLFGKQIHLDQATSRVWIDSPGRMILPRRAAPSSSGWQPASETLVTWQGGMDFDGLTARFVDHAAAATQLRGQDNQQMELTILAHRLDVTLTERFDLARGGGQPNTAAIRSFIFDKDVRVENHRRDPRGRLLAIDRLRAQRLMLDQQNQRLTADGPGWASSIEVQTQRPALAGGQPGRLQPTAMRLQQRFQYARADFQRGIFADLRRQEVHLVGRVQAVYGPVGSWQQQLDASQPGGLGEKGALLTCDRLVINQMASLGDGRRTVEVQALGNAHLENRQFAAAAERMSYDQSKDLYVLEGTARQDALLRRRVRAGGQEDRAEARRILYWRSLNRVQVEDARYLDLSQLLAAPQ